MARQLVQSALRGVGIHHFTAAVFLTPLFLLIGLEHEGFGALHGVNGLMLGCAAAAWLFALAYASGALRPDVLNGLYVLLFITAFWVDITRRHASPLEWGGVLGAAWSLSALALVVCWLSVRQRMSPQVRPGSPVQQD